MDACAGNVNSEVLSGQMCLQAKEAPGHFEMKGNPQFDSTRFTDLRSVDLHRAIRLSPFRLN
jgi:hypothetical protein